MTTSPYRLRLATDPRTLALVRRRTAVAAGRVEGRNCGKAVAVGACSTAGGRKHYILLILNHIGVRHIIAALPDAAGNTP